MLFLSFSKKKKKKRWICSGMKQLGMSELAVRWRTEAANLRTYGAEGAATALERCADELEARVMEWADERLTLVDAGQESGYSVQHLRRLVTQGLLTDVAESGQIRVRRGDLPRKPGHHHPYPLLRTA